jgi:2-haloalkanoic acid dehalogenase type II
VALRPLVTFDLFSALIDSRTGGSAMLGRLAETRGWDVDGAAVFAIWDARNKASQRDEPTWVSFAEHSRRALAGAYAELGLDGDADDDVVLLLDSVGTWPLWPDVAAGLPAIALHHRTGILSNVDDDVFARTAVAGLLGAVDAGAVLTSERLRAYKPRPEIYRRARDRAGGRLLHVATSARDVRGALEAGIDTVHLARPGHTVDPAGPAPAHTVGDLAELAVALEVRERRSS